MPGVSVTPDLTLRAASRLRRFMAVFGPGLVVMLADTDVGSVITAGQSGVRWGYRLLLLQLIRQAGHVRIERIASAEPARTQQTR